MNAYADYMLLLRPDENISHKIANYKSFAESIIGDYPSMRSAAHISISSYTRKKPFIMRPAIDNLQPKLAGMKAISLSINNFKFFIHKNNTYTIYAAIQPTYLSDNWFSILRTHLQVNKQSFIPHLTIARTINENCFYKLWPHFKYIVFREPFIVNSLTVLEKETLNAHAKWEIYQEFMFEHRQEVQYLT